MHADETRNEDHLARITRGHKVSDTPLPRHWLQGVQRLRSPGTAGAIFGYPHRHAHHACRPLVPCLRGTHVTKAMPSQLPPPFRWVEEPERKCLFLADVKILEVCRRRQGWIVHVFLQGPQQPPLIVAVGSANAGMRWGANWAKARVRLLSMLAAKAREETGSDGVS
ncbi:hypothetical protein D3C81_465150 [compost metagenome]